MTSQRPAPAPLMLLPERILAPSPFGLYPPSPLPPVKSEDKSAKRQRRAKEGLVRIQQKFVQDRAKIYDEKKKALQTELTKLIYGTSDELQTAMNNLAAEQKKHIDETYTYYNYKIDCAKEEHAERAREIDEEFQHDLDAIKKHRLAEIANKRRNTAEGRDEDSDGVYETRARNGKRPGDPVLAVPTRSTKKRPRSYRPAVPPVASYREVIEDFQAIFGNKPPACMTKRRKR